ncbi:MAG TPA: hypothetical protein PKK00_10215 [Bacteroidales bacterium]|nr:hypothetical protein [Bacteroidales bacterium]HPS17711.1 hypothetical protein [Bacteroidales bacterium]
MKRFIFIFLFFISFHLILNAQKRISFQEQIIFSNYLVKMQLWDDIKTFLKIKLNDTTLSKAQKDSIQYIVGQVYYKTENFDTAFFYFKLIDNSSACYNNAMLYAAFCLAEVHRYDECVKLFSSIPPSENFSSEFINLERSGAMLLSRDTSGFSSVSENFTYNDKNLLQQEKNLI